MRDFGRVAAVLLVGTIGAGGTVNFKLMQAKSSTGEAAKDIYLTGTTTPIAIAEITDASALTNPAFILEATEEKLDKRNGFKFVGAKLEIDGAAVLSSVFIVRYVAQYWPVDFSNIEEIVALAPSQQQP
jgi:hypothetical protein